MRDGGRPDVAEKPDLAARLAESAARAPDRVALRWQDRALTYAELDQRATLAAGALQHLGVRRGDRVAIILGNTPQFVEAHFGTLRCGGLVVPVNPLLAPPEVEHILADSGARVCVVMAAVAGTVEALAPKLEALEHVVVVGGEHAAWTELLDAKHPFEEPSRSPDDLAALVYTSGTTGRARGAMLTRTNLAANQDQSLAGRLRIEPEDTVLLVLPLFHIYALNVGLGASVRAGATMLLVERFDPAASLAAIAEHGVTVVLGAPPMYLAWLHAAAAGEAPDLSSVRVAVSGAAPLPEAVLSGFRDRFGIDIWEGYGLTEAAPSVASTAMGDAPRARSVGLPLPDIETRLVDDAGHDVTEPGDAGELWIRGPNVFQGYWEDPDATAEALTPDGWLRTGDVATRDDEGYLYLVDRKRDLIIVSGFNVYPREVEQVLEQHPGVAACAVVGVPHPYTGEAVKAFVVPRPDAELSADDLALHARGSLARYKCPETVEIVAELPYTATGKVRRGALRER